MAKKIKTSKATKVATKEEKEQLVEQKEQSVKQKELKIDKKTFCYLVSKANHIIEVKYNNQTTFVQPFGKIKVIKEQIQVNSDDAKYLAFMKI